MSRSPLLRTAALLAALAACAPRAADPTLRPDGATAWVAALGPRPPEPTPEWRGLVGGYAWLNRDTLYVVERQGVLRLLAARSKLDAALRQTRRDVFVVTEGAHAGAAVAFTRAADGRVLVATLGDFDVPRLELDPGSGASFRIVPVRPVDELRREAMAAEPPAQPDSLRRPDLVELVHLDSTIRLDVRYATTNNFMGAAFYAQPRAFLQRPAAEALVRAHRALRPLGYGLLVHDAYRPWYVTRMFWDATPPAQRDFVADPATGSRHNRGAAVDLTLYDLATGRPVPMPSGYDEFTPRAAADWPGGTTRQRWHRALLRHTLEREGFAVYAPEWWHFDYQGWRAYPVMNVDFGG
jgi:D-alanyl-D-alanine dipeptidase